MMDNELKILLGEFNALHGTSLKTGEEMVAYKQDEKKKQQHPAIIAQGYRPGLVDMGQDECKTLCNDYGIEYKADFEKRVIEQVISTETRDRGGDVVRAAGRDVKNYKGNPQVLFGHMRLFSEFQTPVGKAIKVFADEAKSIKRVLSWGLFMDDEIDTSGKSDMIFRMSVSGFLPAASIGFIPKKVNNPSDDDEREKLGLGKWGVEFVKWELLEWSKVVLPMNQEALQNHFRSLGDGLKQLRVEDIDLMKDMKVFDDDNLLNVASDAIKGNINKTLSVQPIKLATEPEGQEGNEMVKCANCDQKVDFSKSCEVILDEKGQPNGGECPGCNAIIDAKGLIIPEVTVIDNPNPKSLDDIKADIQKECSQEP
jgi:hypothetical protein